MTIIIKHELAVNLLRKRVYPDPLSSGDFDIDRDICYYHNINAKDTLNYQTERKDDYHENRIQGNCIFADYHYDCSDGGTVWEGRTCRDE